MRFNDVYEDNDKVLKVGRLAKGYRPGAYVQILNGDDQITVWIGPDDCVRLWRHLRKIARKDQGDQL